MEIRIQIRSDDLVAMKVYFELESPQARRRRRARLAAIAFFLLAMLAIVLPGGFAMRQVVLSGRSETLRYALTFPSFLGIAVYGLLFLYLIARERRATMRRVIRNMVARRIAAGELREESLVLDLGPDRLRFAGADHEASVAWSGVRGLDVTASHAFLTLRNNTLLCVPRRAFRSEADFAAFQAMIGARITR